MNQALDSNCEMPVEEEKMSKVEKCMYIFLYICTSLTIKLMNTF